MKNYLKLSLFSLAIVLIISGCVQKNKPNNKVATSTNPVINNPAKVTSSFKFFYDDVLGVTIPYEPGLTPSVKEEEGMNDDGKSVGLRRVIYLKEASSSYPYFFAFASTPDYLFPPTAGCCFDYSHEPVDVSLPEETLSKTLRFRHLNNVRKIDVSGKTIIRFSGFGGDESSDWLNEYALAPLNKGKFTNILFTGPRIYDVSSEDENYQEKVKKMKEGDFKIEDSTKLEIEEFDRLLKELKFN